VAGEITALAQVRLFNTHPAGEMNQEERLDALMGPGGFAGRSDAQNCEKACSKKLPLVKSIAEINRAIRRGGTSKGIFLMEKDLPVNRSEFC
jgi:succinate dehydrogenase/fumarate reductase-like Fe-S protein